MDSGERTKAVRKLLELTKDPEIASVARKLFGSTGTPESPGLEKKGPIKSIFSHSVIGIIVGIGVRYQGVNEILVRCAVLGVLFLWLVIDSWSLLRTTDHPTAWRASLTVFFLVVFSGLGYSIYFNGLQSQMDETSNRLVASASLPPSNDPYWSKFTVSNGGQGAIGKRRITCTPIMVTHSNGNIALESNDAFVEEFPVTHAEMAPGNAETANCLAMIGPADPQCLDVRLTITYVLAAHPEMPSRRKDWRFVATQSAGVFQWDEQPAGETRSYCALYLNPQARGEYFREHPR